MRVFGIVGGIASGKSLVTEQLRKLGGHIIHADQIGHEVLELPAVRQALIARWGAAVIDQSSGRATSDRVNRRAIADRVFGSPPADEELAFLEHLTHPHIGRRIAAEIDRCRQSGTADLVILDAPVLLEAGWDRLCEGVLFVDAPENQRCERAAQRGWTAEQFRARERAQLPIDEKRRRANWVINNSGTPEETAELVGLWWDRQKPVPISPTNP